MRIKCRSVCLGSYIKWDTKKHVEIIKRELGWKGQEVEGIPPEYDYEKIECFFQGVRDYLKFIKRGMGRTNHLVNIDIRNKRMTRAEGEKLVQEYDGKRPPSLDLFLDYLELTEEQFIDSGDTARGQPVAVFAEPGRARQAHAGHGQVGPHRGAVAEPSGHGDRRQGLTCDGTRGDRRLRDQ